MHGVAPPDASPAGNARRGSRPIAAAVFDRIGGPARTAFAVSSCKMTGIYS